MNSFHHTYPKDIYETPEWMGSGFVNTMPAQEVYKHHEAYSDEWSSTPLEEPSSPKSISKSCLLQKGVIDKCYKSRFYSRAVEFYLLENDPTSFENCRCLMENCPQRSFADARHMLTHLKNCKYFSQGIYRCPTVCYICHDAEKFQTTSSNKCSWDRPRMKQRLQNTFKATVDTVKGIVSPRSLSRLAFGNCKECGQTVTSGVRDSHFSPSPVFKPASIQMPQEVMNNIQVGELMDTPLLELQAAPLPLDDRDTALYRFDDGKVHGYSHAVSNCSLPPNLPIELSSVSPAKTHSTNVSPAVSAESSIPASSSGSKRQCPPADSQCSELPEGALNTEAISNTSNYMDQTYNTWQSPSLTRLYNVPSSHLSMHLEPRNQRRFRESQGYSLAIQTNHLEPALNPPPWGEEARHDASNNTEAISIMHSSAPKSMLSPMSSIGMPSLSNLDTPILLGKRDALRDIMLLNSLSSPDSATQSSSTEQSPSSDLSDSPNESQRCPLCEYRPKGKKENAKAYLNKHISTHGSPSYKCDYCEKVYSRQDNREVHVRKHHKSQDDSRKRRKDSESSESESHRNKRVLYDGSGQKYFNDGTLSTSCT
ncbi:hypothetical protein F4814DRAFT_225567 [Daldinia grandis]|nr:hypothetical protein F4814DRAFT_225567 [Daldinia grandis]